MRASPLLGVVLAIVLTVPLTVIPRGLASSIRAGPGSVSHCWANHETHEEIHDGLRCTERYVQEDMGPEPVQSTVTRSGGRPHVCQRTWV